MISGLIGYTGFVGANIAEQFNFTDLYNSKNIQEINSKEYDYLVCSGISSAMWLANNRPEDDLRNIKQLFNQLKSVKAKHFVFISSVAVYSAPYRHINEDSLQFENSLAYGKNRHIAEELARELFPNCLIVRLPALFGKNLKKNLINDLCNRTPKFINIKKFDEIKLTLDTHELEIIRKAYKLNDKSFFELQEIPIALKHEVLKLLETKAHFTALNFTHPESLYQFYNLENIHNDIQKALKNDIKTLNICSQPICANELAFKFFNLKLTQKEGNTFFDYDIKSKYSSLWNSDTGYLYTKEEVFSDLESYFNVNCSAPIKEI